MGVHNRHRAEAFDWSRIAQATREEYCGAIEMWQRRQAAPRAALALVAPADGAEPADTDAAERARRRSSGSI